MHKYGAAGGFLENFYAAFYGFGKRLFYIWFYGRLKNDQLLLCVMCGGLAWFAQLL